MTVTGYDGVFLIREEHVDKYVAQFRPQCLRSVSRSGKSLDLDYMDFRLSKGTTRERVLIAPTNEITNFIRTGKYMAPGPAASFYVAATRAAQSVAIVVDDPDSSTIACWHP